MPPQNPDRRYYFPVSSSDSEVTEKLPVLPQANSETAEGLLNKYPEVEEDGLHEHNKRLASRRTIKLGLCCGLFLAMTFLFLHAGNFVCGIDNKASKSHPSAPRDLIDPDTPKSAYSKPSYHDGSELQLVFSDEFNSDGRSFYPGDDPYWEALDLHYWGTNDLEYYDPSAVTTRDGNLEITMTARKNHGFNYTSGMLTSWNKFCFTGGLVETSVTLPGLNNVLGLWPAVWTLGNLGRAGYGASLDGLWPYSYDACDVGTLPHQMQDGKPEAAGMNGDPFRGGELSALPGQRLSRCTCPGESHPGPVHLDGTFVGRSAPEIDLFEGQVSRNGPEVAQSAQFAPFNAAYEWFNASDNFVIDVKKTRMNAYKGGSYQQSMSAISKMNPESFELSGDASSTFGFEYRPGFADAYITWISDGQPSWTIKQGALAADSRVEIAERPIPQEPMYLIANLAMSPNFGFVDLENLPFPATFKIDYIRVYQPSDAVNVGCDPADFPTKAYIDRYIEAYTNPLLKSWKEDFNQTVPKNRLVDEC